MENLETKTIQEIKDICKQYNIGHIGDKKTLIKKIKYFLDPIVDVLNVHNGKYIPENKMIVGVKVSEKEKLNNILKSKNTFLYYSLGYQYYLIDKP